MRAIVFHFIILAGCFGLSSPCWADDGEVVAPSGAAVQAIPNPNVALRPFCADRPTKSNGPCTVDTGHVQVELDVFDGTTQRVGPATTNVYVYLNPTVKYGLNSSTDLELSMAPVETISFRDAGDGLRKDITGVGDLFLRVKWDVIGSDGGPVSVALAPYIKAPTARLGVGNGAVEEGLLVPVQFTLPADWSLSLNGEIDALKDQDDTHLHANYIGIVTLSHPLTKTVTGSVELWNDVNDDRVGAVYQRSLDLALAWIPAASPNLQWDLGFNIGLNRATPSAQLYFGVSQRY